jgi:hypothetical protein
MLDEGERRCNVCTSKDDQNHGCSYNEEGCLSYRSEYYYAHDFVRFISFGRGKGIPTAIEGRGA